MTDPVPKRRNKNSQPVMKRKIQSSIIYIIVHKVSIVYCVSIIISTINRKCEEGRRKTNLHMRAFLSPLVSRDS